MPGSRRSSKQSNGILSWLFTANMYCNNCLSDSASYDVHFLACSCVSLQRAEMKAHRKPSPNFPMIVENSTKLSSAHPACCFLQSVLEMPDNALAILRKRRRRG